MPDNPKYTFPVEPADADAEYLTVQETAFVFRCSVKTIRRRCKELGLGSTIGARIMLSRADRQALYEGRRTGPAPRVPVQRRRKSPVKRSAAKPTASRTAPLAA